MIDYRHNPDSEQHRLYQHLSTDSKVPIIGVGGIDSVESAWDMIISGASLIQLYSALVFNGPSVVSKIIKGLKIKVRENNFSNISEAVYHPYLL